MSTPTVTRPLPTPELPPRRSPGWLEFVLTPVGLLAFDVVVGLGLHAAGWGENLLVVLLGTVLGTFALVGLLLALRVRSLEPLRLHLPAVRWIVAGAAAGVGLRLLCFPLGLAWQALTGDTTNPQQFLFDAVTAGGWSLVIMLLLAGLAVPLAEEMLYRGVAYSALRRYGPVAAALGSSAVFGLLHMAPVVIVVAFLLGLVNAVLVERTGSLWPAVASHVVFNLSALVLAATLF
ncbi:CPBP family intramembrane glutamic endopeptidase [Pseudonocardia pini]|uniref:CPBP family intramembrane glutamic endopeptidase n=1 Tax=Pseudonocardia pini TaxID=2758030 RepID=UPI0015F0D574|nr:type II CAAX endopeptidase family protein [Pseudonocardia pini]